ncbi:MAG: tRNA 4-thiouridine(8) synthase ThiI [Candidatus Korarchaeum sp.]|jgi:thiamine biosynthesis protein ThiI|nr:tRNA 4-thiouridine(8) synthase ThiI [Candidatus Korarchaeum sp.]
MREFNALIIRYSEIGLKSPRVRSDMERALQRNLEEAYRNEGVSFVKVIKRAARLIVYTKDPKVREVTKLVLGVSSYSPSLEIDADLDSIVNTAKLVAEWGEGSFAIRVQRVTKEFPMTSLELAREIGARVKESTGRNVDLENPDQEIYVELIGGYAYVSDEKIRGYGGLPVGTQGKVLALISGGIDSPVAAWLLMRRGAQIIPLHFRKSPAEEETFMKIVDVLRRYSHGVKMEPIILEHGDFLSEISGRAREWTCLLCKRRMLVTADKIAKEIGAHGIVTGDSLGQVASQTLANLEVESRCLEKPVFRPLIGMDKEDIVKIAKEIGTYDISISYKESCPFVPKKPKTLANWRNFIKIAEKLGQEEIISGCSGA